MPGGVSSAIFTMLHRSVLVGSHHGAMMVPMQARSDPGWRRVTPLPRRGVLLLAAALAGCASLTDPAGQDTAAAAPAVPAVWSGPTAPGARPADLARSHGTDERLPIANLVEFIRFYHRLVDQAAR